MGSRSRVHGRARLDSTEWTAYYPVIAAEAEELPHFLLIIDRAEIVPCARGHDIGLHAVARAIRTWREDALVVLTAWPPGASGAEGEAGGEALRRHWSRLGPDRFDDSVPPIRSGFADGKTMTGAISGLCDWRLPATAG